MFAENHLYEVCVCVCASKWVCEPLLFFMSILVYCESWNLFRINVCFLLRILVEWIPMRLNQQQVRYEYTYTIQRLPSKPENRHFFGIYFTFVLSLLPASLRCFFFFLHFFFNRSLLVSNVAYIIVWWTQRNTTPCNVALVCCSVCTRNGISMFLK